MYPKFIIVTRPGERMGYLRLGWCVNHKDLVIGYEKVHGGGWYLRDDDKKTITLYGSSGDYGDPKLGMIDCIDREFKDYSFWFTPYVGCPPNPLDMSHVQYR